jgi:hypothetical protein
MTWLSIIAYLCMAAIGWLAGMLTFKRSTRWCPVHGVTLMCAHCERRDAPFLGQPRV